MNGIVKMELNRVEEAILHHDNDQVDPETWLDLMLCHASCTLPTTEHCLHLSQHNPTTSASCASLLETILFAWKDPMPFIANCFIIKQFPSLV